MRLWGFLLLDAWDSFKICRCLPSFYTVKTNAKICWLLFKAHAWPCGWLLKQRFEAERNTIPLCPKLSFLSRCSGCLQCRSRYSLSCPLLTSDRFGTWSKPAPSVGDKEVIGRLNPSRLCVSQTWCHDLDVYHYSKIFQFWFGINVWMILSHVSCETLAFLSFFTAWDVGSKSLSERFWAHFKRLPAWRAAQSVQDLYTVAVGPFLQWGTDEFGAPTTACWGGPYPTRDCLYRLTDKRNHGGVKLHAVSLLQGFCGSLRGRKGVTGVAAVCGSVHLANVPIIP